MKKTIYTVAHHYQPTNDTCGYASLAMFLSHYGRKYSPIELVDKVPQPKDSEGTSHGSITAQLADWCQTIGLQTHMYASDMYVLDLSWKNKSSQQIQKRLEEIKYKRKNPILGNRWAKIYEDAYISMLEHGADLTIVQFITAKLLYKLLTNGPVYANICSTANSGDGRTVNVKLRQSKPDDVNGNVNTHSVVIFGNDDKGNFLVADPWSGITKVDPERMVLAIEAAQIECDNQIFVFDNSGPTPTP